MNYIPSFESKINMLSKKYHVYYDQDILDIFEQAYRLHVDLTPFYSSFQCLSEDKIMNSINPQLRGLYKIQLHNVGKNAYKRYFAMERFIPDWLKVDHYLISFFMYSKIDSANISNPVLAQKLGWLDKNETEQETIKKASRRVTEALKILKINRNTFSVEQRYREGMGGSYHVITANWLVIIPLYQSTDIHQPMSIRARKGIKYRIISFIRDTAKSYSDSIGKLMKKQKEKYLYDLLTMNPDKFKQSRFYWKTIQDIYRNKWGTLSPLLGFGPRFLVPEYDYPNLTLHVKDDRLYDSILKITNDLLKEVLKLDLNINLNIVRAY